jgi:hypothetical protein
LARRGYGTFPGGDLDVRVKQTDKKTQAFSARGEKDWSYRIVFTAIGVTARPALLENKV